MLLSELLTALSTELVFPCWATLPGFLVHVR